MMRKVHYLDSQEIDRSITYKVADYIKQLEHIHINDFNEISKRITRN